jgi:SAM-dependent methyltransferase
MLVMAMEAVQQMCPANRLISGYYVKEAHFMSPIVVKETWDDRTETILHLQPVRKPYEKETIWSDIKVFSHSDNRWTECFRASIEVQYEESTQNERGLERRLAHEGVLSRYTHAKDTCLRSIDSQVFYNDSAKHGIKYGNWFQLLEEIHWDDKANTIARVDVSTLKHETASFVHPAILDAAFHVLRVSTTKGLSASSSTNIPFQLRDAWFSPSGWQYPQTSSIRYLATTGGEAGQESKKGTIYALADDGSILCTMKELITAPVSKYDEIEHATKKLLYGIEWKPQLSLLDPQQLARACDADTFIKDETIMAIHHQKLGSTLDKVVCMTLRQLSDVDRQRVPQNLRRHVAWMEHHAKKVSFSHGEEDISDAELEASLQEIETLHPPWKLFTAVVRHLKSILVGEIDPLEVIFDSNLAETFYADMFESICDQRLRKFLDLASHENPSLRILEVGAGTGGMTSHVVSALQDLEKQSGALKFSEYTYTDISPTFFENAGNRWKELKDRMSFKAFDLERSPAEQGLTPGSYDLIVAGSVLHATEDLLATIRNVRSMLKPGGRLVVLEAIAPDNVITNFAFGLAPGWWRCKEEWRVLSPAIVEEQWDECLKANGFSGNDMCLRDYEDDKCHIFSIMTTTAEEQLPAAASKSRLVLVIDGQSELQRTLAEFIRSVLVSSDSRQVQIISLDRFHKTKLENDEVVISLVEAKRPFLGTISDDSFRTLQGLMKRTKNLLWVTSTSTEDTQYAQYSIVQGFLRSMRSEDSDRHIVTLSIESQEVNPMTYAQYVSKIFRAAFNSPSHELEYIVRDGKIITGRAVEEISLNETLRSLLRPQLREKPWLPGPALCLSVGSSGMLDTLQFVEDTRHEEARLRPHEVEIESKAWALNFRDLLVALGRLDDAEIGTDCAGIVTRVGPDCNSIIQPGDRVCMMSIGCMRTYPRALDTAVIKIPDYLSFEAAASIIVPGITAYYSLIDIARLRKGEKVLIHSGAGSTGQMAIWIAKIKGAEIFATVGFDEKKQFLGKKSCSFTTPFGLI